MKYSVSVIIFFSCLFFLNCAKKDLPAPNPLNASNTKIYQQNAPILTAPCAAGLEDNKISYSVYIDGNKMYFTPVASVDFNEIEILCSDYATYNKIDIRIPLLAPFVGTIKYSVLDYYSPSSTVAVMSHYYNSGFANLYYDGYEGDLYVEYTQTQIILSFCGVKVKDYQSNEHEITGKVVIANNF